MKERNPRLSVVVAALDAERSLDACLSALRTACRGLRAEVLLVHDSDHPLPGPAARCHPWVRVVEVPGSVLVPVLWAEGYRASRGGAVAFTTAHCTVPRDWARSLLKALDRGAAGAGGALMLNAASGPLDWAVFFLRYSAYMRPLPATDLPEIPGDNAAYRREALQACEAELADGFWEVQVHRQVHAASGSLVGVPEATVRFGPSFTFATIVRHRFWHGVHSGGDRAATGIPLWRALLAVPLVPFVLIRRIVRRASTWGDRLRVLASLPPLLCLGAAWALGEGWGAWRWARTNSAPLAAHGHPVG